MMATTSIRRARLELRLEQAQRRLHPPQLDLDEWAIYDFVECTDEPVWYVDRTDD